MFLSLTLSHASSKSVPSTLNGRMRSSVCVHDYNPKAVCAAINWEQQGSQQTYVRHDTLLLS